MGAAALMQAAGTSRQKREPETGFPAADSAQAHQLKR